MWTKCQIFGLIIALKVLIELVTTYSYPSAWSTCNPLKRDLSQGVDIRQNQRGDIPSPGFGSRIRRLAMKAVSVGCPIHHLESNKRQLPVGDKSVRRCLSKRIDIEDSA